MRKKSGISALGTSPSGTLSNSAARGKARGATFSRRITPPKIRLRAAIFCVAFACCFPDRIFSKDAISAGPLYEEFSLILAPGERTEIFGPLYYSEQRESTHTWAIPPLTISHAEDPATDSEEFDFAYPVLTYARFGAEYRWQFFQLFSFAGGRNPDASDTHRFTLFPFYFQQRSSDTNQNYTAFFPIYGHLDHRLFRDRIDFVLFPLYSKTWKKDIITYNAPYPFFHLRHGDGLKGWQLLPFAGHEHKEVTRQTNGFGEARVIGGHDSRFVLWPLYTQSTNGIGDPEGLVIQHALIPFYSLYRSKPRDSTSWLWPLGITHTQDREKKYDEWDAPWPLIEFAHGEGKTERRVWPFFSRARNQSLVGNWYLWPLYKYNRITAAPLDRDRTRILFFLYSRINLRNTETGDSSQRTDFLPFFTHRRDLNGNERLQVLSIIEPFFPTSRKIERDYAPLYSLWRSEKNPRTGAASQSLLWNLYRREVTPHTKKISLLLGLFQYQTGMNGPRWRVCYIPMGHQPDAAPGPSSRK